jgi:hypothetical protein
MAYKSTKMLVASCSTWCWKNTGRSIRLISGSEHSLPTPKKGEDKRTSLNAGSHAVAHVKRLHAFAVAGTIVFPKQLVCRQEQVPHERDKKLSRTFQELSAVGCSL